MVVEIVTRREKPLNSLFVPPSSKWGDECGKIMIGFPEPNSTAPVFHVDNFERGFRVVDFPLTGFVQRGKRVVGFLLTAFAQTGKIYCAAR